MNLHNAEFIKSAATPQGFIRDGRPQIAFAGKSNVGKSSVINRLLNRKNLAKVGSAPGKTTHVNYFLIDQKLYMVDLPGYGYAQVTQAEKMRWAQLMEAYFNSEDILTAGVLIVDARHKPTENDIGMADWMKSSGKPFVVVANKLDKLKKSELEGNMTQIRETLELPDEIELIPFSAEKGEGKDKLLSFLTSFA